jgi:hypothetical protein
MIVKLPSASLAGAVALLVLVAWFWSDRYVSQRALAAHMEQGQAYAARMIEQLGTLPDELSESSGLAVSRIQPGVLWSHNDSGDGPNLYAVDQSGRLLAIFQLEKAVARDWEDMASGPCPPNVVSTAAPAEGTEGLKIGPDSASCLYLADIGDNGLVREELTVYVVVEPRLDRVGEHRTIAAQSFRFRYPDRPHDSEALVVLPSGDATIVSKGRTGAVEFFSISSGSVARALASRETVTAENDGDTGIEPNVRTGRLVTGAALSLDGKTLAVRTYNEVFFYRAAEGAVQQGSRWQTVGRPCFLGDAGPQGEAIDYLDNDTLLLTSERALGRPGSIHRLQC